MNNFWIGVACGIAFVFLLTYVIAAARPDKVQRLNSKFFLDLAARRRKKTILKMNK